MTRIHPLQHRFRETAAAWLRGAWPSFGRARRTVKRTARVTLFWAVFFLAVFHAGLLCFLEKRPALRDPLYHERLALLQQHLGAGREEKPALVVMLGTSRTGNAFCARQMQEKLSTDLERPVVAFNFGLAGTGPVMQQINLRRMLQQGIKPDLVLLEVLPFYFLDYGDKPIEYDQLDLTRVSSEEMDVFAKYGVPRDAYRRRWNEIRMNPWGEMKFHLLRRFRPSFVPPNLTLNWNANIDRWGWRSVDIETMPAEVYQPSLQRAFAEHGRFFPDFRFGAPAVQALIDTLEFCRVRDIPVMLVHLPEDSNFRAWYPPETRRLLEETFARIAREHGAQWIDAKSWVPDGHFFDGHHILKRGAMIFTERLAVECRSQLVGAR